MTIEQKAKAYDEVVNKLKGFIMQGVDPLITRADAQDFFPELKESEGEQSEKWILEYLYDGLRKSDEQFKGQFNAAIAWLEKQGNLIEEIKRRKELLIKERGKETSSFSKLSLAGRIAMLEELLAFACDKI